MKKNGSKTKTRNGLVAALDVGSTKISCFIARIGTDGTPEIVGIGHQVSQGVRNGVIMDMDQAEASIRAAVEAAEEMAGDTVDEVVVALSGCQPRSHLLDHDVAVDGRQVDDRDLRRVLTDHRLMELNTHERRLIHTIPLGYAVDGNRGMNDPRGMFGDSLAVSIHAVTAITGPGKNLETCIRRCHLDVANEVISPIASGLGCLVYDEIDLGATVIDMGGGSTDIAIFYEGEPVFVDTVPIGGQHVTNDIARGLSTTVAHAERIKTLYGSAIPSPSDDREVIKVPLVGEEHETETNQVPRSMLVGIIQPRIEETFELVRDRLKASPFNGLVGRHVVLTGGASQLTGAREMLALMLDKQVRHGHPNELKGLAESTSGPAFSACTGLLRFVTGKAARWPKTNVRNADQTVGVLSRVGQWLRENL